MSIIIQKDYSLKKIREKIDELLKSKKKKPVDTNRYFGKINFGEDGLTYQKKIRDEWK